jgi:nicotinamide-nucleotide amidase
MPSPAQEIGELLKEHKLTLGAAESATGGLISHLITNVAGSSDYYQGSITSYSNEIKMRLLGVKKETLDKYGAVSAQVAEEMAAGGRKALGVDICIADTGIAGPTGATKNKPIGLFYLGLSHRGGTFNRKLVFNGNREQNKDRAAAEALDWVKEYLSGLDRAPRKNITIQIKDVVTCFLESNHRILILRRSAQVGTYQGLWAGVSGYVESTPDEQALTEIQEETGLGPKDVKLKWKGQTVEALDEKLKTRWIIHPYLFKVKHPDLIKFDWEHTETRWILPSELADYPTVPNLKEALDTVINQI